MNNELNVGRGAGYIAGAILQAGYRIDFYDSIYYSVEMLAKKIINKKYDILMISTMTMLFFEAIRLINLVKIKKYIPVLVGGIHPTIMGKKLLEEYNQIDYACIGEGESMVLEFLKYFNTNSLFNVKNLCYRKNGKVICNSIRMAENLAELPKFPWHYFKKNAIVQDLHGFIYVHATRGCPFNCTYCSNGIYLNLYKKNYLRYRPIPDIIEELKFLSERYKPRLFYFGDEMILHNISYASDLFKSIKRELNLPYGFMARVEYINKELINLMVETKCEYVAFGIECGNENFRKRYLNRKMTNQEIESVFSMIKEAGIYTVSFNMIGYPFEDDEIFARDTVELNLKIKPNYSQVTIFYPFPGTVLYDRCVNLDMIDNDKINKSTEYFSESVLKGRSLSKKIIEINNILNPIEFSFPGWKKKKVRKNYLNSYFKKIGNLITINLHRLYKRIFKLFNLTN